MKITNRLFTYPVLSDEKDDYKESIFSVDYKYMMQGVNSFKLTFDITMNCQALEKLILNGQAEYAIHLECSTTAYREVLHSVSKHIEHEISIGRINGLFEVVAFIILKKNINLFAGSILAYQNLSSLDITKDYEEFTNAESIFSVYKKITENDCSAEINLDSAKIRIGLGTKDYDIYARYSTKTELQMIFHSMVIFPALIYVFEELKQEGGQEIYHNKEWFISLERAYLKRGIKFMDEILNDEKTSYQLAQEAMELPLSKALNQISTFFDTIEEDS